MTSTVSYGTITGPAFGSGIYAFRITATSFYIDLVEPDIPGLTETMGVTL